jgi:hypothetical protein
MKLLSESGIADEVAFTTNGRDAGFVAEAARRYANWYVVSAGQATVENLAIHEASGNTVGINRLAHKTPPQKPVPDTLPAQCSIQHNFRGEPVNNMAYVDGTVYYCCCAYPNMEILGDDPVCRCNFNDDFVAKFADKTFDRPICSVCLCNSRVWGKL